MAHYASYSAQSPYGHPSPPFYQQHPIAMPVAIPVLQPPAVRVYPVAIPAATYMERSRSAPVYYVRPMSPVPSSPVPSYVNLSPILGAQSTPHRPSCPSPLGHRERRGSSTQPTQPPSTQGQMRLANTPGPSRSPLPSAYTSVTTAKQDVHAKRGGSQGHSHASRPRSGSTGVLHTSHKPHPPNPNRVRFSREELGPHTPPKDHILLPPPPHHLLVYGQPPQTHPVATVVPMYMYEYEGRGLREGVDPGSGGNPSRRPASPRGQSASERHPHDHLGHWHSEYNHSKR